MEDYKYNKSRTYKIRVMGCIIGILALWLISFFINRGGANLLTTVNEIISSVIGMLVVFLVWEIAKNQRDEDRHDKYFQNTVLKLMRHQNDQSIINLYNNDSVDDVLRNCLSYYNQSLAQSYLNYYKANSTTFRTSMNYRVEIGRAELLGDSKVYPQSQILSYCRHFRVTQLEKEYSFQIFFAMRSMLLEERMNQPIWFYREEITDENLIKQVRENVKNKDMIMEMLKLDMFVKDLDNPLPSSEIEFLPYYENGVVTGLAFKVSLTGDRFDFTPDYQGATTGYISYSAKVRVDLRSTNSFYCIFPEPCLNPKFSIRFDESIKWDSINRITCMSIPTQTNRTVDYNEERKYGYRWISERNRMLLNVDNGLFVFPRSGAYFSW